MKRTPAWRSAVLTLAALGLLACLLQTRAAELAPRPNVLFILADDLRPDGLGALGNKVVKTPQLDRLVGRGFRFHCAYVNGAMNGAVCLPSRTQLLTGQSLFRAKPDASGADPATFTFPRAMKAAGYVTIHSGKFENSPRPITNEFDESHDPGNAEGNANMIIGFIKKNTDGKQPLFMYMAGHEPHDPQFAPPRYYKMYKPAGIPLPTNFLPVHPFDNGEMSIRDEKTLPWPRTKESVTGKLARYYASTSYLDAQVGRVFDALKRAGQFDRTIIILAGDNGLSLGDHGLLGKQNLYEFGGMHVPLVFAGPGILHGETRALAYLYDIFPTVCELAGVPKPARVDGRSLAPIIAGKTDEVRDYTFTAYKDVQRAVRNDRWKLIRYPQINKSQLFDLKADPKEITDLADKPEYSAKLKEMMAVLAAAQKEFGDTCALTSATPKEAAWSPPEH